MFRVNINIFIYNLRKYTNHTIVQTFFFFEQPHNSTNKITNSAINIKPISRDILVPILQLCDHGGGNLSLKKRAITLFSRSSKASEELMQIGGLY